MESGGVNKGLGKTLHLGVKTFYVGEGTGKQ